MTTPFRLPPPDEEMQAHLRSAAGSAARRPADPRYVTFYSRPKLNKLKSYGGKILQPDPETGEPKEVWVKGEGRPVYDAVDYVIVLCPGDKDTVIDRPVNNFDRHAWREKYEAYRNNQSQDTNGVPLEKWGGVSLERVAEYAHVRIKTVEQLADVPDATLSGLGMNARAEREKARGYLAVMKGAPVTELQAKNEELQKRLEALEALAARSNPGSAYDASTGLPLETDAVKTVKPKRQKEANP